MPRFLTPFIGREVEKAELRRLLADPQCRLLTIIGGGGIGKTRLAIECAREIAESFRDGVTFLDLQDARTETSLLTAIIQATGMPVLGSPDPESQILAYLENQDILLVLDNCEDLVTESNPENGRSKGSEPQPGIALLPRLLAACPLVKLLVTSRQKLGLQEEWLFPILGLEVPTGRQESPAASAAVRLFAERAARASRTFHLEAELPAVVRICRQVEGMPLAIELAAAWVGTLSCTEIADEIEQALAAAGDSRFLTSPYRNAPPRHRSMQAICDQSWKLLSPEEQEVFARLSVFRGGFRREAAEQIAGVSAAQLAALAGKSITWRDPSGRYAIHALLRQYAEEKLHAAPHQEEQAFLQHCEYYSAFAAQREESMYGLRRLEVIQEFKAEFDNIQAAWRRSIQSKRWAFVYRATYALHNFYDAQNRYLEWVEDLEFAAQALEHEQNPALDPILAEVLVCLGWQFLRLGRLPEMKSVLLHSLGLVEPTGGPVRPKQDTDPCCPLGILACVEGHFAEAIGYGEKALQRARLRASDPNCEASALYVLASAHIHLGNYQTARDAARQALEIFNTVGNRWYLCYVLVQLGEIALVQGDAAEAESHFQAGYTIREEMGDLEGMAVALIHLGEIALLSGNMEKARQVFNQGQQMYRRIGDRGGLAQSLKGLGSAALALGRLEEARHAFRQALEIGGEMQSHAISLSILSEVSDLLLQTGQEQHGLRLAALVAAHPSSSAADRSRAQALLDERSDVPSGPLPAAFSGPDMTEMVTATLGLLAAPRLAPEAPVPSGPPVTVPSGLLEPLTGREIEILRMIAAGRTNQQIADLLVLALSTVKWYTGEIYGKLQVQNRTQAIAKARDLGWLSLSLFLCSMNWIETIQDILLAPCIFPT